MNAGFFKLIFNRARGMLVPVGEALSAPRSGGTGSPHHPSTAQARHWRWKSTAVVMACMACTHSWANPQGLQVVQGTATLLQQANTLTVTNSANAILNWNQFSIQPGEITRFVQPSSSSAVLNRVVGGDPSNLLGTLTSNGHVFLINPAGILVGKDARIDVQGLTASTLNLSDPDFNARRWHWSATPASGQVVQQGHIRTPQGGVVHLIGRQVQQSGRIESPGGEVLLAAGDSVDILDSATPNVSVQVRGTAGQVTQLGDVVADSGRIGVLAATIRQQGTLNASSAVHEGGRIWLKATEQLTLGDTSRLEANGTQGGQILTMVADQNRLTGTLDAAGQINARPLAAGGTGGAVETSAAQVKIGALQVDTGGGTWLIDPTDFNIEAGSGTQTASGIGADTLATNLNHNNVVIQTSAVANGNELGDINVNAAVVVNKTSGIDTTLTLQAHNNINVNADIRASGSGKVNIDLQPDYFDDALYGGSVTFNGATLNTNGGTLNTGNGIVYLSGDNTLRDTTWTNPRSLYKAGRANTASLSNYGTLQFDDISYLDASHYISDITFNNHGTVNANGSLNINNSPGTDTGIYNIPTGQWISFYAYPGNPTRTFSSSGNLRGKGSVYLSSGTFTFNQTAQTTAGSSTSFLADGGPLQLDPNLSQTAAHGQVSLNTDGTITYLADAGFTGTDTFKYRFTDTPAATAPNYQWEATVTVSVLANTVTVVGSSLTKIYGNPDPVLSYSVTSNPGGIGLTGNVSRTAGENVGQYAIGQGNLACTAVCTLSFTPGKLEVTPRPVSLRANDVSRPYGDANPASGATTVVAGSLVNGDALGSASLASSANAASAAGLSFALTPSAQTFSSGSASNYAISYVDGSLSIAQRATATWTGGSGQWSDVSKWDALPSASNVAAVIIPSGSHVTYDRTDVQLNQLTSAGTLAISGGVLQVSGALSTQGYVQTGGAVQTGHFTSQSAFDQTSGTLTAQQTASIQSNGAVTGQGLTSSPVLSVQGTSIGTANAPMNTHTANLTFNATQGSAYLLNNAPRFQLSPATLNVQGSATGTAEVINYGETIVPTGQRFQGLEAVTITARSPLTINGTVFSRGPVTLTASPPGDLTINGTVTGDPIYLYASGGNIIGSIPIAASALAQIENIQQQTVGNLPSEATLSNQGGAAISAVLPTLPTPQATFLDNNPEVMLYTLMELDAKTALELLEQQGDHLNERQKNLLEQLLEPSPNEPQKPAYCPC